MGSGNSKTIENKSKNTIAGKGKENIPNLKIVVVGDDGVGTTSIVNRYIRNQFSPLYIPTKKVIIDTIVGKINVPGHSVVSVTFWDLPSYEDIDLHGTYFKNMDAAIVVTDINDQTSIEMAHVWKQEILNKSTAAEGNSSTEVEEQQPRSSSIPILLLGNKYDIVEDLIAESMKLNTDDTVEEKAGEQPECVKVLQELGDEHGFIGSFPVSARNNDGSIHMAIQSLIRHVLEKKCMPQKWKPKEKKAHENKNGNDDDYILQRSGILEIDQVYNEVNIVLNNVHTLIQCYDLAIGKFRKICSKVCKVRNDCSIEECIQGLRAHPKYGNNIQYIRNADKLLKLITETETRTDELKKLECAVNCFSDEVIYELSFEPRCVQMKSDIQCSYCGQVILVCRKISTNFSNYNHSLQKYQEQLDLISENPLTHNAGKEEKHNMDSNKLTSLLEENHAKIQKGAHDILKYSKESQAVFKKVESAFAW